MIQDAKGSAISPSHSLQFTDGTLKIESEGYMTVRKKSGVKGATAAARRRPLQRGARKIELVSSHLSYDGPLFCVYTDQLRENGREVTRDVIRHNGSVVILAIDDSRNKKDPMVVLERQYRHAARQFLLELPAGKLEEGEELLAGAKRELLEETGFKAKRWSKLVRYFASPGFLGEWMQVFLAEGITAGDAQPEYDEQIEVQMHPVSEILRMIEAGKIHDGKTLISLMLYSRLRRGARARSLSPK
jgi:ADP-ribose pyrophosphatase